MTPHKPFSAQASPISQLGTRLVASEIRELLKLLTNPAITSFAGGIPDPDLFPLDALREAYRRILEDDAVVRTALQYTITEGFLPLRRWIADHMTAEGAKVTESDILITNGAQQGLDFVGRLLLNPGDAVVVATPSYLGALQTFVASGAKFLSIPSDQEGMLMEPLEQALEQRPKFIYLVPDFANPSGVTMSAARREKLVTLAARFGVPIVEDGAYSWLRYEGNRIRPVIAADAQRRPTEGSPAGGNVIYLGTFSKIIAPALRIGWMVTPHHLMEKFVLLKQSCDLHNSTINQMVMASTVSAAVPSHVEKILPVYRARRNAMLAALEKHFPAGSKWTSPDGGIFIWVELPGDIDTEQVLRDALHPPISVAFVPGRAFHADRSGHNTLRLSFSTANTEQIEAGIARLGQLLREHAKRSDGFAKVNAAT